MDKFEQKIISLAKRQNKTIVLAEGFDPRVIEAAKIITQEKIAKIILLNDTANSPDFKKYSEMLYQIRKEKGLTPEQAKDLIKNPLYYGTMLVYDHQADGMVAGAFHYTADVIRPALQIIKPQPSQSIVSTFTIIQLPTADFGENGTLLFSDCGLNQNPTAEQLAGIAIQSANSFKLFVGPEPRIAMLSYSTNGSATGDTVNKVKEATVLVKQKQPSLLIEGEMQVDAALIPHVCQHKHPDSQVKGDANILIFPDLNSANIGYKLVNRLANAKAFGPITQGLNQPINDLSRGCTIQEIVITTAITCLQA